MKATGVIPDPMESSPLLRGFWLIVTPAIRPPRTVGPWQPSTLRRLRVPGPRLPDWKMQSMALYQLVDTEIRDEDREDKET